MIVLTFAYKTRRALRAFEALVVPVTILETDELRAADAGDRLHAGGATLGEHLAIAIGAVRLLVFACEPARMCS